MASPKCHCGHVQKTHVGWGCPLASCGCTAYVPRGPQAKVVEVDVYLPPQPARTIKVEMLEIDGEQFDLGLCIELSEYDGYYGFEAGLVRHDETGLRDLEKAGLALKSTKGSWFPSVELMKILEAVGM